MTTSRRLATAHDREILRLAVLAFGALVAEPLFLLSDSAIIGHLGTAQLGGLGVAKPGADHPRLPVRLPRLRDDRRGRAAGRRGDLRAAIRQGIDGMWLAIAIGAVLIVVGWPLTPWIVDAFGASPP